MTDLPRISPLRIADVAFLVTSTIERCPKTMMLRELVMNALEAAAGNTPGVVRITGINVGGARKLAIWNTGRGLGSYELLKVTDLSSSLHKRVGLDGNFGMGAKVASLASNRLGLRYRSCRRGRVSQVVIGERSGVYGRLLQGEEAKEVLDVTDICAQENLYGLEDDWTEVLLLGNRPAQDTAASPFDDNPKLGSNWIAETLAQRYLSLPEGVKLYVEASAGGAPHTQEFTSSFSPAFFDRMESVRADDGVILHYAYRAPDSDLPTPPCPSLGMGVVAYGNEVYALLAGYRWTLESPAYGFAFAARQCTVIVELPDSYPVIPEVYRQFLRFQQGDQRQVFFRDFGELVATNIPDWLKRIIAAMAPGSDDYLAEIRSAMSDLLTELGLNEALEDADNRPKRAQNRKSKKTGPVDGQANQPQTPRPPKRPAPPEILLLEDEQSIVEKGLAGRAARYYPASRQLFVNLRYTAFKSLMARLEADFAGTGDPASIRAVLKPVAESVIVRRLGRALIFALAKKKLNWSAEELARVLSPESLSLTIDDLEILLADARVRVASHLGRNVPVATVSLEDLQRAEQAQRLAAEHAEAEARLQQSIHAGWPQGHFLRRLAEIEMRRNNPDAAIAWLQRAATEEPSSGWPYVEIARIHQTRNDLDGAIRACDQALEVTEGASVEALLQRGSLEMAKHNLDSARGFYERAVALEPDNYWARLANSHYLLSVGNLEGAQADAECAVALSPTAPSLAYLRMGEIAQLRGNSAEARNWVDRALEVDPDDLWANLKLSKFLSEENDLEGAEAAANRALASKPSNPSQIYRRLGELAVLRDEFMEARSYFGRAVEASPFDPWPLLDLSKMDMEAGDFVSARALTEKALALKPTNCGPILLRLAEIESSVGRQDEALQLRERAVAEAPNDIWAPIVLARQLISMKEIDRAEKILLEAIERLRDNHDVMHTMLAEIYVQRNLSEQALECIDVVVRTNPKYFWAWMLRSQILLRKGDLDQAEDAVFRALEARPQNQSPMFRRLGEIAMRRPDPQLALKWGKKAMKEDPADPWNRLFVSDVSLAAGDLEQAHEVSLSSIIGKVST